MLTLAGRLIVVAGAGGGGIGTEMCRQIAQVGGHVLALDNSEQGCAIALDALGGDRDAHTVARVDLQDEAAVQQAIATEQQRRGPVRGLVNIVGGIPRRELIAPLLDEAAMGAFDQVMRHNLVPPLSASRAVARLASEHGQGASIVNTASIAGHVSMAFAAGYGAAKAALIHLTRTMAVEWGRHGIRVNAVSPGTIRVAKLGRDRLVQDDAANDENARRTIPLGRRGDPQDVTGPILFFLSDLSGYVTGQTLAIDGGGTALPAGTDASGLPLFMANADNRERVE